MTEAPRRYLARGTLTVKARGFWFTGGGEKGVFGYFPHLKTYSDGTALPFYPDTQVHGDLKAAAQWLDRLEGHKRKTLIQRLFGAEQGQRPSLLFMSDLTLVDGVASSRFSVKPKTRISDLIRTNENHMLAHLEYAWLDEQTLISDFWMGYFSSEAEVQDAQRLLEEAASFLPGFGAFRSRGKGRGKISVDWRESEAVGVEETHKSKPVHTFQYFLEALVNFRNKPLSPGTRQLLDSQKMISDQQLRGWFVKAYFDLKETWPTPDQMQQIHFSPCYPARKNGDHTFTQGFPPPFSTVSLEDGSVQDRYGEKPKQDDRNDQENLFKPKAKPLSDNCFLTNENPPRMVVTPSEVRMRNSLNDDFVTREENLFAQELILSGVVFGCTIQVDEEPEKAFARDVMSIFRHFHPIINGCIFEPHFQDSGPEGDSEYDHLLVAGYLPFEQVVMDDSENQIRLTTLKRYNTTLKRPRRNRPVFGPGSLVKNAAANDSCISWHGFKAKDIVPPINDEQAELEVSRGDTPPPVPEAVKKMTRAQMGLLRALLQMEDDALKSRITSLADKYAKWDENAVNEHLIPKSVITEFKDYLDEDNCSAVRENILMYMEGHAEAKWRAQLSTVQREFETRKKEMEGRIS